MAPDGTAEPEPPQRLRDHVTRNLQEYYGRENMRNVAFDLEGQEGDVWTGLGTVEVRDYLIFGVPIRRPSEPAVRPKDPNDFTPVLFRCHIDLKSGATRFHTRRMDASAAHQHGLVAEPSEVSLRPRSPEPRRTKSPGTRPPRARR